MVRRLRLHASKAGAVGQRTRPPRAAWCGQKAPSPALRLAILNWELTCAARERLLSRSTGDPGTPGGPVESVSLPRLAASFPLRGCRGTSKQPTVETHSLNRAEHLHLPRAPHRGARGLGCPCPGRGPWPGWQPPLPRGSSAQKDQGREDGARSTPRLQTVQGWLAGALERQGLSRENTGRATARRTRPGLRAPDRAQ